MAGGISRSAWKAGVHGRQVELARVHGRQAGRLTEGAGMVGGKEGGSAAVPCRGGWWVQRFSRKVTNVHFPDY